jgi:protocatechuate 3,4-dioxygenase beta subunit
MTRIEPTERSWPGDDGERLVTLGRPFDRRKALSLFAGAGLFALVGCSPDGKSTATGATTTSTTSARNAGTSTTSAATSTVAVDPIPAETAGPYPGDGSNGPNVLNQSGIVRSDITSSFGSASGIAKGVPLTVELTVLDAATDKPLDGATVYLWHCDQQGRYSLYSPGATGENYLRGVQAAGSDGKVVFKSIVPAAYPGRWPHIHFEVYPSLAKAQVASGRLATSQLALPEATCNLVFATDGYGASVQNMKQTSLANDNVFSDDRAVHQIPTMSGDVTSGMRAALTLGV